MRGHTADILAMAAPKRGGTLVTAAHNGELLVWNLHSGTAGEPNQKRDCLPHPARAIANRREPWDEVLILSLLLCFTADCCQVKAPELACKGEGYAYCRRCIVYFISP